MGDKSKISWTDATWNPILGCTRVSEGCRHCYAEIAAARNERIGIRGYSGLTKKVGDEIRWTGKVSFVPEALPLPVNWKRPRRIFVNSMSDLFHEAVPDGWVMRILDVMCRAPHHTYQILTKRPERMRSFFTRWADLTGETYDFKDARGPEATRKAHPSPRGQLFASMLEVMGTPPEGCAYPLFDWMQGMRWWPSKFEFMQLGVSVEDQATADERIPLLISTPAHVKWISYEPALSHVDFKAYIRDLDWIVIGGESGPGARPFSIQSAMQVIEQCAEFGVACYMKQVGAKPWPWLNLPLKQRQGADPSEWPGQLNVREFPVFRVNAR